MEQQNKQLLQDHKRETTDIACLVIYILFTLSVFIAGIYCLANGSTNKLEIPYDPDGKGCGVDYPDYKYIYFPSPQYDSLYITTCIKQCPMEGDATVQCKLNSLVTSCLVNNDPDNTKSFHIYATSVSRGNVCIPESSTLREKVQSALTAKTIQEMFRSLISNWPLLLIMGLVAFGLVLIITALIRFTSSFFVYIFYFLFVAGLIGFGIYLIIPNSADDSTVFILKQNRIVAMIIAIVSFILAFIILVLFLCYRKRIALAANLIEISVKFLAKHYKILLLPLILLGCLILFMIFWTFIANCFYSMGTVANGSNQLPFQHYTTPWYMFIIEIVHIFYLFWGLFFLMDVGSFIVSGAVINWYYEKQNPEIDSAKRFAQFHLGSVCLGSFLTALFGPLKLIYELLTPETNKEEGCFACIKCLCNCICCVCSRFLFSCFNNSAYTFVNLRGTAYCQSAWSVTELLKKQTQSTSALTLLHLIFSMFVVFGLAILNILFADAIIDNMQTFQVNISNRVLVYLVVGAITLAICQFFISIYSQGIQAIYITFLFRRQTGDNHNEISGFLNNFLQDANLEAKNEHLKQSKKSKIKKEKQDE